MDVFTLISDRCPKVVFTGSHAYGEVKPTSDVDIVVQLTVEELAYLKENVPAYFSSTGHERMRDANDYPTGSLDWSLRVGRLNFLIVTRDEQFEVWRQGTERCKALAKATERGFIGRELAVSVFQSFEADLL